MWKAGLTIMSFIMHRPLSWFFLTKIRLNKQYTMLIYTAPLKHTSDKELLLLSLHLHELFTGEQLPVLTYNTQETLIIGP